MELRYCEVCGVLLSPKRTARYKGQKEEHICDKCLKSREVILDGKTEETPKEETAPSGRVAKAPAPPSPKDEAPSAEPAVMTPSAGAEAPAEKSPAPPGRKFPCFHCKSLLQVRNITKKTRIKCPKCGKEFYAMPSGSAPSAAAPEKPASPEEPVVEKVLTDRRRSKLIKEKEKKPAGKEGKPVLPADLDRTTPIAREEVTVGRAPGTKSPSFSKWQVLPKAKKQGYFDHLDKDEPKKRTVAEQPKISRIDAKDMLTMGDNKYREVTASKKAERKRARRERKKRPPKPRSSKDDRTMRLSGDEIAKGMEFPEEAAKTDPLAPAVKPKKREQRPEQKFARTDPIPKSPVGKLRKRTAVQMPVEKAEEKRPFGEPGAHEEEEREERGEKRPLAAIIAFSILLFLPLMAGGVFLYGLKRNLPFAAEGKVGHFLETIGKAVHKGYHRINQSTLKFQEKSPPPPKSP
jgi:hypothetical protein